MTENFVEIKETNIPGFILSQYNLLNSFDILVLDMAYLMMISSKQ